MKSLLLIILLITPLISNAYLYVDKMNLNFGNTKLNAISLPKRIQVSNRGEEPVQVVVDNFSCLAEFRVTTYFCTYVAPGSTCYVDVTFRPNFEGSKYCSLKIRSRDEVLGERVYLSGTGVED